MTPCTYCGFAVGLTGHQHRRHCYCGAIYCENLCRDRDWRKHKARCGWHAWRTFLKKELHFPEGVAVLILNWVDWKEHRKDCARSVKGIILSKMGFPEQAVQLILESP